MKKVIFLDKDGNKKHGIVYFCPFCEKEYTTRLRRFEKRKSCLCLICSRKAGYFLRVEK